jgi:hypothetical protein
VNEKRLEQAQKMVRTGTLQREANVHEKRLEQAQKTVKTGPCTLKLSIKVCECACVARAHASARKDSQVCACMRGGRGAET